MAVPDRSNVQTATRIRQSDAGRFCHVAAPGDGRTPGDWWNHSVWETVFGATPKTTTGTVALPSKVPIGGRVHGGRLQRRGQRQFGVDERGKGRLFCYYGFEAAHISRNLARTFIGSISVKNSEPTTSTIAPTVGPSGFGLELITELSTANL